MEQITVRVYSLSRCKITSSSCTKCAHQNGLATGAPAGKITSRVFRAPMNDKRHIMAHYRYTMLRKSESTTVLNNSTQSNATGRQPTLLQNRRLLQLTVRHFRIPLSWLFRDVTQNVDSWLPTFRDSFSVTSPRTQQFKEARVSQSVL